MSVQVQHVYFTAWYNVLGALSRRTTIFLPPPGPWLGGGHITIYTALSTSRHHLSRSSAILSRFPLFTPALRNWSSLLLLPHPSASCSLCQPLLAHSLFLSCLSQSAPHYLQPQIVYLFVKAAAIYHSVPRVHKGHDGVSRVVKP